ncbi:hypothetical protein FPZ42_16265 [Mucilaginibacter achroorhodeus]|uniref:Uncharacterized protein n=1 Tax=Mucilaginibacter achroorhodeus TaxID=2599294 RepID=A0A563TZ50_9SPHI|nr:hypothetical protein [Mucilaginibacter achroorhodeus]TWR24644.1 hypothetical protein FPZ42_16265 [Mucilaginibacter achroorhodeus]
MRNQIEAIAKSLSASPSFLYGTEKELNTLADDITFPCVFMHPLQPVILSPHVNGSVNNVFTLYLEFLFKTDFGRFTAENEDIVQQALLLANEFIVKASKYRDAEGRYFKIKPGEKAKCVPVYNKFDSNTTGVGLTITLNTMYFNAY